MIRILLTGPPGCGKTTIVREVARILAGRASGFLTTEIRDRAGNRQGFLVETLAGQRGELARKGPGPGPRVGSYRVDLRSFEATALPGLAPTEGKVVVIDEIGRMECLSEPFRRRVAFLFASRGPLLATIPWRGGGPFIEEIRSRRDVDVVPVTPANRDALPREIAARFLAELGS